MKYTDYLQTDHWKNLRSKKNKNCGICGATKNLDVHHLNYKNLFDVDTTDLRTLCRRCHFLAHDLLKSGKLKFTSKSHHSRFAFIKNAVKKELGLATVNLFYGSGKQTELPIFS